MVMAAVPKAMTDSSATGVSRFHAMITQIAMIAATHAWAKRISSFGCAFGFMSL